MVQIIQERRHPSFAEKLNTAVGRGIEGGNELYQQKVENESAKKYGVDLSGIRDPELRKIFATQILKGQNAQVLAGAKTAQQKKTAEEEEQGTRNALNWLEDNVEYTGAQIPFTKSNTAGKLNREAVERREQYDATGFWVADKIYTHFNKGQITDKKLKMIQEKLAPRSGLSERENKARIEAIRRIANLPRNAPQGIVDKKIDNELKVLGKIEKTQLNVPKEKPPLESFYR
jgi:hypothetical protein